MQGREAVRAIFARLFDDDDFRVGLMQAGDDAARQAALRQAGFRGDFTIGDVRDEVRRLLTTGKRPSTSGPNGAPAWAPAPGTPASDAPFLVKEARRAAPTFGRLAASAARPAAAEPAAEEIRATYAIVGTIKGGTSALDHFLSQHPSICTAPQKETHFFCRDIFFEGDEPEYEWYSLSFSVCFAGEEVVGEATPIYMYDERVAPRLRRYNPDMKLIFLLRDPVARAYSEYHMLVARKWEQRSFDAAIDDETAHHEDGDGRGAAPERRPRYLEPGFYTRFIPQFLEHFPQEQMLFLRSEDLLGAHSRTLAEVHSFLGVGSEIMPEPRSVLKGSGPPLEPATKARLLDIYEDEIVELERFTGWDLTDWRR